MHFSWSFSKYAKAILIRNKEAITFRNVIANFFIWRYPEMSQTDNWKEFTNSKLKSYIKGIGIDHIFGAPYHPQSQSAIEASNKAIQRKKLLHMIMSYKKDEWDFELNLFQFLHFYNCYKNTILLMRFQNFLWIILMIV